MLRNFKLRHYLLKKRTEKMATATITIFVYGTLKRGFINHERFCGRATEIRAATVWGRLYQMRAGYPALQLPTASILAHGTTDPLEDATTQANCDPTLFKNDCPDGDWDLIRGELITFADPETDLPPIDWLEGFRPGGDSYYRRVLTVARSSAPCATWTYISSISPDDVRLTGGVWPERTDFLL